ncbi:MAG: hemerythrin family protein [candidate division Zixibacteria bacterium]|nr:hemerythrin family protein [candidate division Zixibacteria bacterium]
MRYLTWDNAFSTGIRAIDDEHRLLVQMITQLQRAQVTGTIDAEIARVLRALVDYVGQHFGHEEAIMAQIDFAEIESHKVLHQEFAQKLVAILTNLREGKTLKASELLDFLAHWLTGHIIREDGKIGRAFRERQSKLSSVAERP